MSCPHCSKGKRTIMKRYNFTNADLRCAAAVVCNAMLEQLPEPSECRHTFSEEFEQKIRELMERKNHHETGWHKFAQRAAAVILAVLLGLGAWLAVDQDARAAVARWVREFYENSIVYRFFGNAPTEENFFYKLTWVPEGYEITNQVGDDSTQTVVYQKESDVFTFMYLRVTEDSLAQLIGTRGDELAVSINGIAGQYYEAADSSTTNDLIWINEDAGVFFSISSFLSYEDIMHIAEGVQLDKLPK